MTHAEKLLWLAERDEACSETEYIYPPTGQHLGECACKGTGKVPRFPLLWQECPNCGGGGITLPYFKVKGDTGDTRPPPPKLPCPRCQGRGWVPVDDTTAIIWSILSLSASGIEIWRDRKLVKVNISPRSDVLSGLILNEVLVLSLYKLVKGESDDSV